MPRLLINLLHGPRQRGDDRLDVGDAADHREPRGKARAFEMTGDLVAHDVGLLGHLGGERIVRTRRGLVDHDRERRLERVGEIADMGAGALDDLAIGVEQRIGLAGERRDFHRKLAFEALGGSGPDRRQRL